MKIAIASDHAGFIRKEEIKTFLQEKGYEIVDYGTDSEDSMDYPDTIHPAAESVAKGEEKLGIIFCGSGIGASIVANKHKGIRAALTWNKEVAKLAREHNNANIISIPARFVSEEEAKEIVLQFLQAEYLGGRHQRRNDKIEL